MHRALVALGLCLSWVLVSALPATAAASSASLSVSATRVSQGGVVRVSGRCEPDTSGVVISKAFLHDATHDFAGVGAVSFTTGTSGRFVVVGRIPDTRAVGTYTVTARCGGGNLGISRRLLVVAFSLPRTGSGPVLPATALGLALLAVGSALLRAYPRDPHRASTGFSPRRSASR
jgi:hypothetical protein